MVIRQKLDTALAYVSVHISYILGQTCQFHWKTAVASTPLSALEQYKLQKPIWMIDHGRPQQRQVFKLSVQHEFMPVTEVIVLSMQLEYHVA